MKIHLWLPGIFDEKGGIQVFSGYLVNALQAQYPEAEFHLFSKNDHLPQNNPYSAKTKLTCTGNWQAGKVRTIAFLGQVISAAILERPDLILMTHLNFSPAAAWLKQFTGIPFWTIAHGVEAWGITKPSLRKSLQQADLILPVSNFTRDRLLQEQNLDPQRLVILPNTFTPERFTITPKPEYLFTKYGIPRDRKILLSVGRLVGKDSRNQDNKNYKGYDRIFEALPTILAQVPEAHYLLVGKGDDLPRIQALIGRLNLNDHVTLAGFVPDAELPACYNLCDLFVMPSKGEGFGIVYLEAMACGKPVIAGNQDGAVDALARGELGVLVEPDDPAAIAMAVIQVLQGRFPNSLLYQPDRLRETVIARFGIAQFQATLTTYIQRYLKDG